MSALMYSTGDLLASCPSKQMQMGKLLFYRLRLIIYFTRVKVQSNTPLATR